MVSRSKKTFISCEYVLIQNNATALFNVFNYDNVTETVYNMYSHTRPETSTHM
jgi:hypothetical protein